MKNLISYTLRAAMHRVRPRVKRRPEPKESKPAYVSGLAEAYARDWAGCPCVFVLSTGRVGTETLAALLRVSPDFDVVHEPPPVQIYSSFLAYMEGPAEISHSEAWLRLVRATRDDFVVAANRSGRIYVETNNRLTYLAPAIARAFPESKFIHLHRDPYEVISSGLRRGWYMNHPWDFARIRPRSGDAAEAQWQSWEALEKIAWYWAEINRLVLSFTASLPEERIMCLASNDLFAGTPNTVRDVFHFAGGADAWIPENSQLKAILWKKLNAHNADSENEGDKLVDAWSIDSSNAVWGIISEVANRLGYTPPNHVEADTSKLFP